MKKLLILLAVLKMTGSQAQIYAGSQGFTIKSGTEVSFENLFLRPSSDFNLAGNRLQKSQTPVPFNPNASITRVYRFESAITFSGTMGITYLTGELNGNTENNLQILYAPNERAGFIRTTGSTVNQSTHRVSNVFSNTGFLVISAASDNPLPVTLVDFTVRAEGRAALLQWSTSSEMNADRFVIQRSSNTRNWIEAGAQAAGNDSRSLKEYSFTDMGAAGGMNYYRLKMIDRAADPKDEIFAYSQIRSVQLPDSEKPAVFPNPVAEKLFLKNPPGGGSVKVSVYEISGRLLLESTISPGEGLLLKDLSPGSYVLKTEPKNGQLGTYTFVKQ